MRHASILLFLIALLPAPLTAQEAAREMAQDTGTGSTGKSTESEIVIGSSLRGAEIDLLYGAGRTWAFIGDVDFIRHASRPAFSAGLRAGWEFASSVGRRDAAYRDHHANLLARVTADAGWFRLDLFGGYAFVTHSASSYDLQETVSTHHLLKLGGEMRIMVLPHVFGLVARYSVAGRDPLNGTTGNYDAGGIGFVVGWMP